MIVRHRQNYVRLMYILIGFMLALMMLVVGLVTLRALVRVLPGRYAYYLPEPLLALRHVPHPDVLPTPQLGPTLSVITYTPSPTPATTPTPTVTPTPPPATPTPVPTSPPYVEIAGLDHEHQGWNNCGPTTLAMLLNYWGESQTQRQTAPVLKPDPEDKNVSPHEMAAYARDLGLAAWVRPGGDLDLLKRLLAHDIPVIIETWEVRSADDQLGHYRLVVGYDDSAEHIITYDSLHGPDITVDYAVLDELWRVFNRTYLVIVPPDKAETLAGLLGPAADASWATAHALAVAQEEAESPPESCVAYARCEDVAAFAWFNVGTNLVEQARYEEAALAFDQARAHGLPWRVLWYQFGPYEAYTAVGRAEDVISLATQMLNVTKGLEESHYWRGQAYLLQGNTEAARADFEAALRYHEDWAPAVDALAAIDDEGE